MRGANPGFDLRIPVTRELVDTKVGPFLKLRPVDPTINIRQLMVARDLVGPFLNIGDFRFEANVLRGFKLAGGERMSIVREPAPKDALPSPALRDLMTLNYAGPFADHGEAVVDEQVSTDFRTRMDVDTGFAVRLFRHHTRDKRNTQQKQLMCQTVYGDGIKSRIRKYDLVFATCSRIAIVSGLQIGL